MFMAGLPKGEGSVDEVARHAERAKQPLELPDCEGLPREMLESVRERRLAAEFYFCCTK